MRKIFCLLYTFALLAATAQESGWPAIRNYSPKEYLGQPQVFSALQDRNTGILYFGTVPGISSYDGTSWRQIPTPSQTVGRALLQGEDGRIYVGATDHIGFLEADAQGKMAFKSINHLISDSTAKIGIVGSVKNIGADIFFQTSENIFRYLPGENAIQIFKADTNGRFGGVFTDGDVYYCRLSKKGLIQIKGGKMSEAPQGVSFKEKKPFNAALTYGPGASMIFTRADGIYLYNSVSGKLVENTGFQEKGYLLNNIVYTASAVGPGVFATGSLSKGAVLFDGAGKTLRLYDESNVLEENGVLSILYDKNDNLWLGLSNGLAKTEKGLDLSHWNKKTGLKGGVLGLVPFQNKMYVATGQNVFSLEEGGTTPRLIEGSPPGQHWVLREINTDKGPVLWMGTHAGIYQIENGGLKQIHKGSHALELYQATDRPDRVYSTDNYSFISLINEKGAWKSEGAWEGINEQVRSLEEDGKGGLWLGTYSNGLIRVQINPDTIARPKQVKHYGENDGLPSLKDILPFRLQGKLLFGTIKGIFSHNPATDRFEPFCGLGNDFCNGTKGVWHIQEMKSGRIYISPSATEKQDIGYLEPDGKGGYAWVYAPFRRITEMAGLDCMYADEKTGKFWVGGNEGLFMYDQNKDSKEYKQTFPCFIRQVSIAGDSAVYYGDSNLKGLQEGIQYGHNSVKFHFSAPFFDQEDKTLYNFRLEGFDTEWSGWGRHTQKEYTNLWEGVYTFHAKAKNVYGVESPVATFQITVLPPAYRTWWAYSLYLTMVALLVFGAIKYNTRRLEQEKKLLEGLVSERTAEVVKQSAEILKKNAEMETQQAQIVAQNESIHLKNMALEQQKEEILSQNEELHQSQEELVMLNENLEVQKRTVEDTYAQLKTTTGQLEKSIRYASHIQGVVMPETTELQNFFSDVFILFKPRDVVSGDFYWFSQINEQLGVFVLADCTGHGVPGAFMSMLASTLLHETINVKKVHTDPARVLRNVHSALQKILKQVEGKNDDGMDVSICSFEKQGNDSVKLIFAGAKSKMSYVSENSFHVLAGDKEYIGGKKPSSKTFTNHEFVLPSPSVFYMYTDGFSDQNDVKRQKLGSAVFEKTLYDISSLPFPSQNETLELLLSEHQGKEEQRDDILVVGLKL